jgi:hypothetical protein
MSRCISCDKKFHPALIRDYDGNFIRFEEMCKSCVSLAYEEETYDEIFDPVRVRDVDGVLAIIQKISTEKDEY